MELHLGRTVLCSCDSNMKCFMYSYSGAKNWPKAHLISYRKESFYRGGCLVQQAKLVLGTLTSHWSESLVQVTATLLLTLLSTNELPEKQQVMAQILGFLPPT